DEQGFGGNKRKENELKKVNSGPRYLAWSTRCYPQKRKNFLVGFMASKADKGKQKELANEGLKRLRKGTKGLSSSAKGSLARRFREKAVEPHRLIWFNTQKRQNMLLRTGLIKAARI
ncbi:hypothetical protein HAX54_002768, partial [Datura stramonium]|nr:hypothetical protein [Datura stramonium]